MDEEDDGQRPEDQHEQHDGGLTGSHLRKDRGMTAGHSWSHERKDELWRHLLEGRRSNICVLQEQQKEITMMKWEAFSYYARVGRMRQRGRGRLQSPVRARHGHVRPRRR